MMLRCRARSNQLLHRIIKCKQPIPPRNQLTFSSAIEKSSRKKKKDKTETVSEQVPTSYAQEEYAEIWEPTTDDRIEQLTNEIRKASGKKIALFGTLAAFSCSMCSHPYPMT